MADINSLSEAQQIALIRTESISILQIKNPSIKVQIAAIETNPYNISRIENPNEEVQLLALGHNIDCIQTIKKPCKRALLYVLGSYRFMYYSTPYPLGDNYLKDGIFVINYINKHCLDLNDEEFIFNLIKEGYEDNILSKLSIDPTIEMIQYDSVLKNWKTIQSIENPTERIQLAAISKNILALKYIKKPTNKVKIKAIKKNKLALLFIKNKKEIISQLKNSRNRAK